MDRDDAVPANLKTMLDVIGQMERAGIGRRGKWARMRGRIRAGRQPSPDDCEYYGIMTRNYRDASVSRRSMRIYHTRLSGYGGGSGDDDDDGNSNSRQKPPPCSACGKDATHYCNMNDQYFCMEHIVGHDDNEA